MATLDVTRDYADGEILLAADLDAFLDDLETFLNITKLNDDNIQTGGITGSLKLANASVTKAKMAADSVGTTQIVDSNITTAKIADSNVTTAKIADDSVTTAKILDSNVTTAKIADNAVTKDKLKAITVTTDGSDPGEGGVSKSTGYTGSSFSTTSTSFVDVTNHSLTITTTGRPVAIFLESNSTDVNTASTGISANQVWLKFVRDSTDIAVYYYSGDASNVIVWSFPTMFIDTPSAGTYTYKLQIKTTATGASLRRSRLVAYEL